MRNSTKAQGTGKKRGQGSEFERMVRKILRDLEDEGLCKLWKLPTDLRLVAGGKLARGEPMPADFMGSTSSGRCIMIECKDVDRPRLPLGTSPGLSPYQLQAMAIAEQLGAGYMVLWRRGDFYVNFGPLTVNGQIRSVLWAGFEPSPISDLPSNLRDAMMPF